MWIRKLNNDVTRLDIISQPSETFQNVTRTGNHRDSITSLVAPSVGGVVEWRVPPEAPGIHAESGFAVVHCYAFVARASDGYAPKVWAKDVQAAYWGRLLATISTAPLL